MKYLERTAKERTPNGKLCDASPAQNIKEGNKASLNNLLQWIMKFSGTQVLTRYMVIYLPHPLAQHARKTNNLT